MKKFNLSIKLNSPLKTIKQSSENSISDNFEFSSISNIDTNNINECKPIPEQCVNIARGANGTYFRCDDTLGLKISNTTNLISNKKQIRRWIKVIETLTELHKKIQEAKLENIEVDRFIVLPHPNIGICKNKNGSYKLFYNVDHIKDGLSLDKFLQTSDGKNNDILRELYIQILYTLTWFHQIDCDETSRSRSRTRIISTSKSKMITMYHNDLRKPNIMITKTLPFTLEGKCIIDKMMKLDSSIVKDDLYMKYGYIIKIIDWEMLNNDNIEVSNACKEYDETMTDKDCAMDLLS